MPKLAAGSPTQIGRSGHLVGLGKPDRRCRRPNRRRIAKRLRRRDPSAARSPPAGDAISNRAKRRRELLASAATSRGIGRVSFAGSRPIGVPLADEIADAIFVAVDGEFVGGGQQAALDADLAQLLFVDEQRLKPRSAASRHGQRQPTAVVVPIGFARIDKAVPQFRTGFGQSAFEFVVQGLLRQIGGNRGLRRIAVVLGRHGLLPEFEEVDFSLQVRVCARDDALPICRPIILPAAADRPIRRRRRGARIRRPAGWPFPARRVRRRDRRPETRATAR